MGWYESAFHHTDEFGRKSGYGYEYQRRLSIYTGWTYEYVEGSWSQLLEKLIAGELDLLSDVSYTDERAEKILYSAEAMGSEGYHVFIAPENKEIRADDFSTLNGKRVGVNKNSIQEKLFVAWAESHNVTPEIVESTEKTPVLLEMLAGGEFDALVTLDTYGNSANVIPVWKVGFAESFFGINKNRPELKQELDVAMNRLFEDNRDYNQQLTERFNKASTVNSFLTSEEKEWLDRREVIRVGYRDNFLPFCDLDDESGRLTGALSDFLSFAANSQRNATLRFETRAFQTMEAALQALASHEIDCVFPLSISAYDGEQRGVISTDPIISSEMYAVVRTADHQGIERDRAMTVALPSGHPSYETFVKDHFPNWKIAYYDDNEQALRDIASGKADCMLVSNYRLSRVNEQLTKYKLSALATDEVMYVSFVMIYDTAMEQQEERDQRLLNDLDHALEKHELEVYYQPKYAIQSTPPKLASAEALVRWKHPELGMISPENFIRLFEQSGQISILDNFVWEEAARQIAAWRDQYHFTMPVSVNLSRVDVFDPGLIATLDGIIQRYGLKSGDLKLEVTESAYTENADQLIRVIGELRGKGYEIEMDDFGSGYSSLNMLSSLPLDVLKMDIDFIRNIERNEKDFRLVELIIDIARYLRVPVVAEGVETENQLKLLKDAGCDIVQGYYFSRPLPAEEFSRKILKNVR
ncbi:MAG: EAL domain-containing protein [Clostridia bacterium]|nr:EAL domain-containing protein [Clostridia bacterium]